jgi:hypothetical protein
MSQPAPAPFLRDPVTVPRKELIDHYRTQAARYRQLAERQQRSSVHDGLLDLARQCDAMAKALTAPAAEQRAKPELSKDELLGMLDQVLTEEKKAVPAAPATECVQSPVLREAARELSLEEILQKIQRDIAEDRPAA